ncbi:MAG: hypothetical protein M3220_06130 [Chloroflexota bacterium]|nr:hypothetical protein [Chloroflexota bacterium]
MVEVDANSTFLADTEVAIFLAGKQLGSRRQAAVSEHAGDFLDFVVCQRPE